jgi:hypothetical protein
VAEFVGLDAESEYTGIALWRSRKYETGEIATISSEMIMLSPSRDTGTKTSKSMTAPSSTMLEPVVEGQGSSAAYWKAEAGSSK